MIKAIIFDFYGVICSDSLVDLVGKYQDTDDAYTDIANAVNSGRISWGEFCREVAGASGKTVEQVEDAYTKYSINRELIAYIAELKLKYKVGLLTNANHAHIGAILEDIGADTLFDEVVVSGDIGMVKPQPGIYQAMLTKLSLTGDESVFIDDAARNLDGADGEGMATVLYTDFAQMRKELEVLLQGDLSDT